MKREKRSLKAVSLNITGKTCTNIQNPDTDFEIMCSCPILYSSDSFVHKKAICSDFDNKLPVTSLAFREICSIESDRVIEE